MIVVTGAAGKTAGEAIRLLSARGIRVRALVRDPQKVKGFTGPAVEVVTGDLGRPTSLDPAFRGADKLFLVSSPDPEIVTLHGNAIEAAKRAGIRHIVRLSVHCANPQAPQLLLRTHGEVDERLSRSGISFTILRSHAFFQNTLGYAETVATQGMIQGTADKDGRIAWIDLRDVAQAAATILTSDTHSGRLYDLSGPEALSHVQIAEKLSAALGREVRYVELPRETAREALLVTMPEWLVDSYLDLAALYATGMFADVSDAFERITGKKPRSYDQFAKEFSGAFGGAERAPEKAAAR